MDSPSEAKYKTSAIKRKPAFSFGTQSRFVRETASKRKPLTTDEMEQIRMTTPKSSMGRQVKSLLPSSHGVQFSTSERFDPSTEKQIKTPTGLSLHQSYSWTLPDPVSSLGRQWQSHSKSVPSFSISGGGRMFPFKDTGAPKGLKPDDERWSDTGLGPASPCFTAFGKQPSSKRKSPGYPIFSMSERVNEKQVTRLALTAKVAFANDINSSWESTSKFSRPTKSSMGTPSSVNQRALLKDNGNPGPGKYGQGRENAYLSLSGLKGSPKSTACYSFGSVKPGKNAHSIW